MPRKIAFARIIDRRNTKKLSHDPAQFGGFRIAIADDGMLTVNGIRNAVVFRAERVVAAIWENDETILFVQRLVGSQDMTVRRTFRSRIHREWDSEDVPGATATISPEKDAISVSFTLPNCSVRILPFRSPCQEWTAQVNLGTIPESIIWIAGRKAQLTVKVASSVYKWIAGQTRFTRSVVQNKPAPSVEGE